MQKIRIFSAGQNIGDVELPAAGVVIGAGESCEIRLSSEGVQERHSRAFFQGRHLYLENIADTASKAG
jgi:hypothetical protein